MADMEALQCQNQPLSFLPPGLESLYLACRRIYPEQPNPLQVAALVKYWYEFQIVNTYHQFITYASC